MSSQSFGSSVSLDADTERRFAQQPGHAARSRSLAGTVEQHRRERLEDLAHLRRLVGKHGGRIHVVHDGGIVRLEDQTASPRLFSAQSIVK